MKHYYFVFQNLNFEHESTRGYLWCPYIDRRGVKHFYWDNIEKLKIGDILLHGANQKIVGISKEWFTWGDSYELDISEYANEVIALAVVLAINCVIDAQRNNNH